MYSTFYIVENIAFPMTLDLRICMSSHNKFLLTLFYMTLFDRYTQVCQLAAHRCPGAMLDRSSVQVQVQPSSTVVNPLVSVDPH